MKITLEGVSKTYPKTRGGVRDISLEIGHQQFFTLMGPSGAGKSTLLHLMNGSIQADAGRILFDDREVTSAKPEKRPVHTVFQGLHLFPHMTVQGNIAFTLEQSKNPPPRDEIRSRVTDLLRQVGLTGYHDRRVTELSGGEKQRVAIARSLVDHPQALLLDEPFAPLDRTLKESLIDLILSIKREAGLTIVLTTHDWYEALRLSDRIAVVRNGGLAQVGTPQELFHRPRTLSIGRLTGPLNVFEENGAHFGIRPAFVKLGEGPFEGTVEEVLFAGDTHQVRIRMSPDRLITAESEQAPAKGSRVTFDMPREHRIPLEREDA